MMKTVWERAAETDKPILLYGTGNGADKILDELLRLHITVSGVFASDGFVRKRTFRGFPVMSYSEAKAAFGDFLVLIAFGSARPEVLGSIAAVAKERELYSVDVPVYGDTVFNRAFYENHMSEITKVQDALIDDFSKHVFGNIIGFKLTGQIDLLTECQTDKAEAYENILKPGGNEIYMDLGAYNGDTVMEFIHFARTYKKIYAAEPDIKNFKKLCENTADLKNIERMNLCVTDTPGSIRFSKHGGRNASDDSGGAMTECSTVDRILDGGEVSYIKFDVEGFEAKAIKGASGTIKKHKPKMLVSCYHRSEDIFALPLQILALRPDYKMHIRHYPYIPAWDTQFYFV